MKQMTIWLKLTFNLLKFQEKGLNKLILLPKLSTLFILQSALTYYPLIGVLPMPNKHYLDSDLKLRLCLLSTCWGTLTFCIQISAIIESGIVRLNARVPIRDDVRKQPLWTESNIPSQK